MLINHEKKFVLLAIPKTASTSIHILNGQLEHPPPEIYHSSISSCLLKNPECETYFKACFVRNPFDRFVSTWCNLTDPDAGHTWAQDLLEYKSFDNFCKNFVISKWSSWVHFLPQTDFIFRDNVDIMDFIGRYENLQNDYEKFCLKVGLPIKKLNRYRYTKHENYRTFYNEETKKIIENFYKKDLEYFEYDF